MITNFENVTFELTKKELEILPFLIAGFKSHKKDNPIKAFQIVKEMNNFLLNKGYKVKMTGVRLRKCVHHIRCNGMLPLIATSDGYFVTLDKEIIEAQIKSLYQRASSIRDAADGLGTFTTHTL